MFSSWGAPRPYWMVKNTLAHKFPKFTYVFVLFLPRLAQYTSSSEQYYISACRVRISFQNLITGVHRGHYGLIWLVKYTLTCKFKIFVILFLFLPYLRNTLIHLNNSTCQPAGPFTLQGGDYSLTYVNNILMSKTVVSFWKFETSETVVYNEITKKIATLDIVPRMFCPKILYSYISYNSSLYCDFLEIFTLRGGRVYFLEFLLFKISYYSCELYLD